MPERPTLFQCTFPDQEDIPEPYRGKTVTMGRTQSTGVSFIYCGERPDVPPSPRMFEFAENVYRQHRRTLGYTITEPTAQSSS